MNLRKGAMAAAVSITALGTVAACGSGGADGSVSVQDHEVKVGVSVPLSGATATAGTATSCGVQAALDGANKDGGVDGYTFTTIVKDNQYDPGIASSIARDFVNDGVFATIVAGTATMESTVQVAKPRGVAVFGSPDGSTLTPPEWEGEFGYNAEYTREGASAADFIHDKLGEDTASSVYLSPAGKPAGDEFAAKFQELGGTVPLNEAAPAGLTDYAPLAQKLASAGAPVVYTTLVDTQLAALQKAASAVGYNPKWVAWTITQGPSYQALAGGLAEGVYFSMWAIPDTETDDPEVRKFVSAVKSIDGCTDLVGDNATKTGYALGSAIIYGVQHASAGDEELTSDALIDSLSDIKDQQFGLTPHMAYTPETHAGVQQNSYWQLQGGKLVQIRGFEPLPDA